MKLYSTTEAGRRLGVSRQWIARLVARLNLDVERVGNYQGGRILLTETHIRRLDTWIKTKGKGRQ